ncbi:LOW QUALITY PROTEIN: hypothetical protein Cgig2_023465 [Carnegiea gigantea]|uniref:Uncharacterized protein n=1 Tax=Carnegiea gigantea TaxID=171969 RepID=A0A9Q1K5T2_9CARY|nr:LOW QUALITY PROTEIN: hypothetical protein Cgig2_023465 [Carnegiea gigantea]
MISSKISSGEPILLYLLAIFTLHISSHFCSSLLSPLVSSPFSSHGLPISCSSSSHSILDNDLKSSVRGLDFATLITLCDLHKSTLPQWALFGDYHIILYLFIGVNLGISNMIMESTFGIDLVLPYDKPRDDIAGRFLWAKVEPHALLKHLDKALASATAITTSFLVMKLMHKLIFHYMTCTYVGGYMVLCLHGLCVVGKVALKRVCRPKVKASTSSLTVGFVIRMGFWWLFPPLVRNQANVRATKDAKTLYEFNVERTINIFFL